MRQEQAATATLYQIVRAMLYKVYEEGYSEMPSFEVSIPGTLYRNWPAGEEIRLVGCVFQPGDNARDFVVSTEVNAPDEDAARQIGRDQCVDATNLLAFCMDEQVNLEINQDHVRETEVAVSTGSISSSAGAALVVDAPPTTEQIEALRQAHTTIDAEPDEVRKEALIRSIHWQARGRREVQSTLDRFINFWIALEVLVRGEGTKVVPKVKEQMMVLYPEANEKQVAEMIGRIYGIRADIVHRGITEPQDFRTKLDQLEDITADLLRHRLGLSFKAFAARHLR